jgi:hypothetical protein
MKDYKRLTERYVEEKGDFLKKGTRLTLKNAPDEEILERLAELEDKIENGTLVELPCKVGDIIYEVFKNHKPPFIQQTKVEKIIITETGLKLKLARNSFYETSIASLGKIIFLTEDEARKKLKELEK